MVISVVSEAVPAPGSLPGHSSPMRRLAAWLTLLVTFATACGLSAATPAYAEVAAAGNVFYLSANGNDAADGRTTQTAWRSLSRASTQVFAPGDQILLQGGETFPGMLYLDPADAGNAARPVVVGSYGTGRGRIAAVANPGVYVYNTAGVEVRDLEVVGDAAAYRNNGGISFYNDLPGSQKLAHVVVANVDVSGFKNGIEFGGAALASGFRDITVSDSRVHGNMEAGLISYGPEFVTTAPTYAHANLHVIRVEAFGNLGDPTNLTRNTGNGIVLGSVADAVVEQSSAHGNGGRCVAPEGPAGIWTYDATRVVMSDNLSYSNRSGGPADGDGFDLDQNVSSSVVQRNLSYDNDGAGFLVYTGKPNNAQRDNVVRFNVSSNDARRNAWYGGITLAGRISTSEVYANTVVMTGTAAVRPPAIRLGEGLSAVTVRNNVLSTAGGGAVVQAAALGPAQALLQGNNYDSGATPFSIAWGSRTLASLDALRSLGQERVAGEPIGSAGNPQLRDPGVPWSVTNPSQLREAQGYMLATTSPLRGRGLDLTRRFGTAVGTRDYYGTVLPAGVTSIDVGAHQPSAVTPASTVSVPAPAITIAAVPLDTTPPATAPRTTAAVPSSAQTIVAPTLTLSPSTIFAGQATVVSYRGSPGSTLDILSRTQPATVFSKIGTVTLNGDGVGTSSHKPQKNTRITARAADGTMSATAPIIAVRSLASFNVTRTGARTYAFTGRVYPALVNRSVKVYCDDVLVGQGRSDATGVYAITRTLGAGTFVFQARTTDDQHNLGAESARRLVEIA